MPQSRWFPIILATALALGAFAIGWNSADAPGMQWQMAARYTARVGFPFLIIAYAASSLLALWPNDTTRTLMRRRRHWGLGFALSHSIHFAALTGRSIVTGDPPVLTTLIGGGGAYGIMWLMAATSNNWSMRALGVWWKRLHTLGIHWLWFIFTFSYFGRLFEPERMWVGVVGLAVAMAALGLRVAVWVRRRGVLG